MNVEHLVKLRHFIHSHPELSSHETSTAQLIRDFLTPLSPNRIITNLGGNGIAAVFKGDQPGKSILLRCDMDALPIQETNKLEYRSKNSGVSHKCGHDGHMVILLGIAEILQHAAIPEGDVILLFQPAEETGAGALNVLKDPGFGSIRPDSVYALHNLPGFKSSSVIIKDEVFASASVGMEIKLFGKTSHAGEPERGINPANAVSRIIQSFSHLSGVQENSFITIVHIHLGEIAYGTSAGYAEVRATVRTHRNSEMKVLAADARKKVLEIGEENNLRVEMKMLEDFPAAVNHSECTAIVEQSAAEAGVDIIKIEKPFSWSEDFAQFLLRYPGCLFGLGSGRNHPDLHHPDYDFPDAVIPAGIAVYQKILENSMGVQL